MAESNQITDIDKKISAAAQQYFCYKGAPEHLKDYAWDYNLVKIEQRNAWCMPGGFFLHRDPSHYKKRRGHHRNYGILLTRELLHM